MGYTVMENGSAYDRGVAAGEISARLANHDLHFKAINGSIERLGDEMHLLVLQVQRLGDSAESDRATVLTTAAALKDANLARREAGESRWAPLQRLSLGIGIILALCGLIAFILSLYR